MKTKILTILLLFLGVRQTLIAQGYSVGSIPAQLKEGAIAVVRADIGELTVQPSGRCVLNSRLVYTILNEQGEKYATKHFSYDKKFTSVNKIQARLYDASGEKIRELKSSEILDRSNISDFSLHEDDRVKTAKLTHNTYPFTVEFISEQEYASLIYFPVWYFQWDNKVSVQKSIIRISTPANQPINYKEYLLDKANQKQSSSEWNYIWTKENIKAFEYEPMSGAYKLPYVRVAPQEFELEGYKGSLASWELYGKWCASLAEGRTELPIATQNAVAELVRGVSGEEEKIKRIYEYMQSKTRYVSIQLGIGGFQPFTATFVDTKGFGDCKALANYTKSLLAVAGIKSHYTLIRAGENTPPIDLTFPSFQFNHAILCVPLTSRKDTIWLECTSQQEAAGYMGDFTGNRYALLITDQGGVIARTPQYDQSTNTQTRTAQVVIAPDGSAKAEVHHSYRALQEDSRHFFVNESTQKQRNHILNTWELPTFTLGELKMWREKQTIPVTHEQATVQIDKLAIVSGKRLFLQPNLFSKWDYIPQNLETRTSDIELSEDFVEYDTMRFTIPENYYIEASMPTVSLKTAFGQYEASAEIQGGQVIYIRRFAMKKGTFGKEKFTELVDFYKKISKADAAKIVFVNKT